MASAEEPSPEQAAADPTAWGQPITPERQAELQTMLDAWNAADADHGVKQGPFAEVTLTGAEVSCNDCPSIRHDDYVLPMQQWYSTLYLSWRERRVPI